MKEPVIRITVDGLPACTIEQLATRYGLKPAPMRVQLSRWGNRAPHLAKLDGRKPLYDPQVTDALMAERPGKGAPGQARPDRALAQLHKVSGSG